MPANEAYEAILAGETFPDGLTVDGSLYLDCCISLTALPDGMTVDGSLDLSGCTSLTVLPNGLTVDRWLNLEGCTSLKALPEKFIVSNWLGLDGCRLWEDDIYIWTSLPETIVASLPGRRLSEVFSHRLLNGRPIMDLVIKSAEVRQLGPRDPLVLHFDENTLDYLEVKP
jgi:hypothetical protein